MEPNHRYNEWRAKFAKLGKVFGDTHSHMGTVLGKYPNAVRNRVRNLLYIAKPYEIMVTNEQGIGWLFEHFAMMDSTPTFLRTVKSFEKAERVVTEDSPECIQDEEDEEDDDDLPDEFKPGLIAQSCPQDKRYTHYDMAISIHDINDERMDEKVFSLNLALNDASWPKQPNYLRPRAFPICLKYDPKFITQHPDIVKLFLYNGDSRLLIAIIKLFEDSMNLEDLRSGVRAILVIEDTPEYYSEILTTIYQNLLENCSSSGVTPGHRFGRRLKRPKVFHAINCEEARRFMVTYKDSIMAIISDINLPDNPKGGYQIFKESYEMGILVPRMFVSDEDPTIFENEDYYDEFRQQAFWQKSDPDLSGKIRTFFEDDLGFERFVFKHLVKHDESSPPTLEIVKIAESVPELMSAIRDPEQVPDSSILYHATRDDFSSWMYVRGEFGLSEHLREFKVNQFDNISQVRNALEEFNYHYQLTRTSGILADFTPELLQQQIKEETQFVLKIGHAELGGKARGIRFLARILQKGMTKGTLPASQIYVPSIIGIATDIYDRIMEYADIDHILNLGKAPTTENPEKLITDYFLKLYPFFPPSVAEKLKLTLETTEDNPMWRVIVIRPSSLMEDARLNLASESLYKHELLSNSSIYPLRDRLCSLIQSILRIYASLFFPHTREVWRLHGVSLSYEKMAILLQPFVGTEHSLRLLENPEHSTSFIYPDISGKLHSLNSYAITESQSPTDGYATLTYGIRTPKSTNQYKLPLINPKKRDSAKQQTCLMTGFLKQARR